MKRRRLAGARFPFDDVQRLAIAAADDEAVIEARDDLPDPTQMKPRELPGFGHPDHQPLVGMKRERARIGTDGRTDESPDVLCRPGPGHISVIRSSPRSPRSEDNTAELQSLMRNT